MPNEHRRTYMREYMRRYYRDHREEKEKWKEKWTRENPEKQRAHNVVTRAIATGKLIRPKACQRCGRACKPVAHHPDYSQPLAVEWVCGICHRIIHGNPREDYPGQRFFHKHNANIRRAELNWRKVQFRQRRRVYMRTYRANLVR
jgi:hypothetical protein